MALQAAYGEIQCVLANAMMGFAFFLRPQIIITLKYFVNKYLTSITNTVQSPHLSKEACICCSYRVAVELADVHRCFWLTEETSFY